jgi:hypothetical protein
MQTNFYVLCGTTVPESYTWDLGAPLRFVPTTQTANSTVSSISGYAPALNVIFYNNSQSDRGFDYVDYDWDFGDQYNSATNFVSLTCTNSIIEHLYIMPGIYTVSLRQVQTRGNTELDPNNNINLCRSKYGIRWFWDELKLTLPNGQPNTSTAITWNETTCTPAPSSKPKHWSPEQACLQKYCKTWSWYDLGTGKSNPIKWTEVETDREFQKKWMFEPNDTVCSVNDASFLNTVEKNDETRIEQYIVTVKELPPVAIMSALSTTTGLSPHTVRLSPKNCKPGSFPIDRIDWDFGDGSPIKTITRYSAPTGADVVNTGFFISDLRDVRNIDVIHTYYRYKNMYPVFYPSLTCYSANTNTSDACCITVGPISYAPTSQNIQIVKGRNTLKGNVYAITNTSNNNISLVTTNSSTAISPVVLPTTPSATIRDGRGQEQTFFGYENRENPFPSIYEPVCTIVPGILPGILPEIYLETEDSTPSLSGADETDTSSLTGIGVPIFTEFDSLYIIP